jgi:hypothetical protein
MSSSQEWDSDEGLDFLLEKIHEGFQRRNGIKAEILEKGKKIFDIAYAESKSPPEVPLTPSPSESEVPRTNPFQWTRPTSLPTFETATFAFSNDAKKTETKPETPEPVIEYPLHTQAAVNPAFADLLKEKMRSDYNQGYPKGVKFINVVLNNHLTQLETDLDKTWKMTQECLNLVQNEMDLRANPRRLGSLFKPFEVMPMLKDLEEVIELVFGRILMEAAMCTEYHIVTSMEFHLWNTWKTLREHLYHTTFHLNIPRKNNPLAFYREYQERTYGKLQEINLDTLEELQVAMERYRMENGLLYADEIWPVERKEEWWRDQFNTKN